MHLRKSLDLRAAKGPTGPPLDLQTPLRSLTRSILARIYHHLSRRRILATMMYVSNTTISSKATGTNKGWHSTKQNGVGAPPLPPEP
jgi:hypothetical protein